VERLYTFSRAILLTDNSEPFPRQLVRILADTHRQPGCIGLERASRAELVRLADEEAKHLKELVDDAVEMGRLDNGYLIEAGRPWRITGRSH
jgi:hypothetical protein